MDGKLTPGDVSVVTERYIYSIHSIPSACVVNIQGDLKIIRGVTRERIFHPLELKRGRELFLNSFN
jgi:CMP-2-keto-3-deoxyoctulosonic acid synthetase